MSDIDTTTLGSVTNELEAWLRAQCDGDWEHSYGISIESTDNPGWHVEIDLRETAWANREIPFQREERSLTDWVQFQVKEAKFVGSGGVENLTEVLRRFLKLTRS